MVRQPQVSGFERCDAVAMVRTMNVRTCLCGVVILMATPVGAGQRLALKVFPAVAFAPANLIVRTTVEADPANRAMEISAESPDFYRSSAVELDGENAPRTTQFEFRSLPSGRYSVRVTLVGSDGHPRAYVRTEMNVMPSGGSR